MLDALYPSAETFKKGVAEGKFKAAWQGAVEAAEAGAQATKTMQPRLGRASYLGERAVGHPDGGAVAVAIWVIALLKWE